MWCSSTSHLPCGICWLPCVHCARYCVLNGTNVVTSFPGTYLESGKSEFHFSATSNVVLSPASLSSSADFVNLTFPYPLLSGSFLRDTFIVNNLIFYDGCTLIHSFWCETWNFNYSWLFFCWEGVSSSILSATLVWRHLSFFFVFNQLEVLHQLIIFVSVSNTERWAKQMLSPTVISHTWKAAVLRKNKNAFHSKYRSISNKYTICTTITSFQALVARQHL